MATSTVDKVMLALEHASQMAPEPQQGWVSAYEVNAVKTEYGLGVGSPVTNSLHDLVAVGRAQSKVVRTHGQATTMFRPFRGGVALGGEGARQPGYPEYPPGETPRGGNNEPDDFRDVTTLGGGGGVPVPIGGIVRNIL